MDKELTGEQVNALIRIINNIKDHLSIVGRDYCYQVVNDAYLRATCKQRSELIGHSVAEVLGTAAFEKLAKPNLDRCFAGESVRYHSEFSFPGYDRPKFMEVSYDPLRDESGQVVGAMVSAHDVTELDRVRRQLGELANIDPLTRLPNRRHIREILAKVLARAMRDGSQCHVFFCDLNDFKQVNDQGGHDHGDAVLREVSSRLRATLRGHEDLGRWGGDEFLVVIGETLEENQRLGVISRLRQALEDEVSVNGSCYQLGISVGSAHYPDDGADIATLLRLGDSRMYRDKAR